MTEHRSRLTAACSRLFCVLLLFFSINTPIGAASKLPNFIIFLVDDYDKYETSVYGGQVLTPNLDRLSREGMTFYNAHVTSTVCTPSRYTFLTGRYAGSSYSPSYLKQFPPGQQVLPGFNMDLEEDNMNVGNLLARNGYATGYVGKYHVGPGDTEFRRAHGLHLVPKNVPYSEKINRQQFENEKRYRALIKERGFTWAKHIYWENTKAPFQMHNPEWTIEAAVEFIEQHQDRPFYLHYCTTLLHGPNRSWWRSLDHPEITGEGKISRRLAAMPARAGVMQRIRAADLTEEEAGYLWMDDSLGVLLAKLDQLGIAENTVVLFIADHGSSNKGSLLKSRGTEVPCIIRWPAGIVPGTKCRELIQNTDFVPTWFHLAGAQLPPSYRIDGISIAPLFKNPARAVRSHVYAEIGAARSIKTKQFNYIALRYTEEQIAGARKGTRRYLKTMTGLSGGVARSLTSTPHAFNNDQLYDLNSDLSEQRNLANDRQHQATLAKMRLALTTELKRFKGRPFGEFVPGGNAIPGGTYDDVLRLLRKEGQDSKNSGRKRRSEPEPGDRK